MRRILRYEVPVDDQWHVHELSGELYHVNAPRLDMVEFWALDSGGPPIKRSFRVFGTGQNIPDDKYKYRGTAIIETAYARLVWHLMEVQ